MSWCSSACFNLRLVAPPQDGAFLQCLERHVASSKKIKTLPSIGGLGVGQSVQCVMPPRTGKLFRFRFSFSFRVVRVVRAKLCVRARDDFPLGEVPRGLCRRRPSSATRSRAPIGIGRSKVGSRS